MGRHEQERAGREARRDMAAEPTRVRPHESGMASFVAGMAYEEKRREETESKADRAKQPADDANSKAP